MTGSRRHRSYDRMRIIALCALIALVAAEWIFLRPGDISLRPSGVTASIDPADQQALVGVAPNAEAYSSIITSDLFSEKREAPPGVLVRSSPPSGASASGIQVIGIVTFGAERLAVVAQPGGTDPLRARVGDSIAGAKVSQITPNYIVLVRNGVEQILTVEPQAGAETQIASNLDSIPKSDAAALDAYDRAAKATMDEFMGSRQFDSLTHETAPPTNPPAGH